jgi:hypothetical protein
MFALSESERALLATFGAELLDERTVQGQRVVLRFESRHAMLRFISALKRRHGNSVVINTKVEAAADVVTIEPRI